MNMNIPEIQKRIELLDKLVNENKISNEMLKSELETDPEYNEANSTWKELNTKKKRIKETILATGSNKELVDKIKENQEEINAAKEILAQELMQVYQTSKSNEIEDATGQIRKFKLNCHLSSGKF
jgi:hypothetical protein